jgi:Psb28 protein
MCVSPGDDYPFTQLTISTTTFIGSVSSAPRSRHIYSHHHTTTTTMKFLALSVVAASLPLVAAAFATSPAFTSTSARLTTSSTTELDMAAATISFVRGLEEKVVPKVKLTRARDGSSGVATFSFNNPNCFDASTAAQGEVTGMFMADEEG